jgi:Flp pilus assembly protein CpaB
LARARRSNFPIATQRCINTAKKAGDVSLDLRSIADLSQPQGATSVGRVYRDGVSQDAEGVRVYRYGTKPSPQRRQVEVIHVFQP